MIIVSDLGKIKSPIYPELPLFVVSPVEVLIEEGINFTETRDDAIVVVSEGATVDNNKRIEVDGGFADSWVFQSLDSSVAKVDRFGNITRVSDGIARIIASDQKTRLIFLVSVSRSDPVEVVILQEWVEGSFARFSNDTIFDLINGITASNATRALFTSGGRNDDLFCVQYSQALTAVAKTSSAHGSHIGLTAITPRHVVGCHHALHPIGGTVTWETVDGVNITRTIIASYEMPEMEGFTSDTQLYLLDDYLPSTITPCKLPPEIFLDYIKNPQFGIPLIFTDRDNIANIAITSKMDSRSLFNQSPPGDLQPFYTWPMAGTSGKPLFFRNSETEMMIAGTFSSSGGGPSHYARNWTAAISAVDALAGITRTNLLSYSTDLSERASHWLYYEGGTKPVHTPDAIPGPFPGTMACMLTFSDVVWPIDSIMRHNSVALEPGVYTWSVYLKGGTMPIVPICARTSTAHHNVMVAPTGEWQRVAHTFEITAEGDYAYLDFGFDRFNGESGAGGTVYIYGVQLNPGATADPFLVTGASPGTEEGTGYLPARADLTEFTDYGDPLIGIPTLLDLRTHKGDKVPRGINPADSGGNALWSGIVGDATQSNATKQPLTKFATDGTPYLDFDGVDDWMSLGSMSGTVTYSILARSKTPTWNSYWSFMDTVGAGTARFGAIGEGGETYIHSNPYPVSIRRNGVALPSPFDCAPLDEWAVYTVVTQSKAAGEIGMFQLDGTQFGSAQAIALFIHDGTPTTGQVEAVEAYLATLQPSS